jgi:DNA-binding NtrC family response regulator
MSAPPIKVSILIVNNDFAETNTIKSWLEKDMRLPWAISHCVSVEEARSRINKADLVILKPEMGGLSSPKEVFKNIDNMVFEVPILVLTSEGDEHGLSTYVMEQGAADTLIRGQFARLVDAVEFALIRQKLKTDARKNTDQTLTDSQDKNAVYSEKQRQILRMLSGDYAVDQQDKPKR